MTGSPVAGTRPNVIVFFTDQQRWDTIGAAGNPSGLTPNLDAMARRGTMFETAVASNPVCAPSRSAILTGRYPTATGVWRNDAVLPSDVPTIGTAFRDAGYRTGYIGKWHLASAEPVPAAEREGFDFWLASNLLEFTSDAYRTVVYDELGDPVELPGYRADALTDAAIRFVADSSGSGQPFVLFVSLIEPHHQNEHDDYPAPEVYRDAFVDAWVPPDLVALGGTSAGHYAGYCGQVKRLDEAFGRLRDALVSMDLADSTLVAYTSDHGSHFKTRNAEYKRSAHDASIRVPLLIEGPGVVRGRRVSQPVTTADLTPTLLRAAGIDAPAGMRRGLALTAGDLARTPEGDSAVLVQISESETGRALRTSRWTYHVVGDGIASHSDSYTESGLWDLEADPYQLDNVIGLESYAGVAEQLRQVLLDRILEVENRVATVHPAARVASGQRQPETKVRERGLRGVRFGHQPRVVADEVDTRAVGRLG